MKKSLILIALLILTSCSSNLKTVDKLENNHVAPEAKMDQNMIETATEMGIENPKQVAGERDEDQGLKIMYTYDLYYITEDFDQASTDLESLIKENGGYIIDSNLNNSDSKLNSYSRDAYYSLKIPADKVETFVEQTKEKLGSLTSERRSSQDATKTYKDSETRLKVFEDKEKRLRELLGKAENIEDILKIESSLAETIAEKEVLKSTMENIDDKVAYSQVNISLSQAYKKNQVEVRKTSFIEKLGNAINDSFSSFKGFVQDFIIGIVYLFPYLVILAIIAFVLIKFIKKRPKIQRDRKEKEEIKENNDQNNETR